jgi:hypothetical protein
MKEKCDFEVRTGQYLGLIIMCAVSFLLDGIYIIFIAINYESIKSSGLLSEIEVVTMVIGVACCFMVYSLHENIKIYKERKLYNELLRKKELPYGFEYFYELEMHKNIGENKKKRTFEKYSAWHNYILDKYQYLYELDDFYRFLKRKRTEAETNEYAKYGLILPFVGAMLPFFFEGIKTVLPQKLTILIFGYLLFLSIMEALNITVDKKNNNKEIQFIIDLEEVFNLGQHGSITMKL